MNGTLPVGSMSCSTCPVAAACHYPYKPTECFEQRKFWTLKQLHDYQRLYGPRGAPDQGQFAAACEAGNKVFGPGGTFGGHGSEQ